MYEHRSLFALQMELFQSIHIRTGPLLSWALDYAGDAICPGADRDRLVGDPLLI